MDRIFSTSSSITTNIATTTSSSVPPPPPTYAASYTLELTYSLPYVQTVQSTPLRMPIQAYTDADLLRQRIDYYDGQDSYLWQYDLDRAYQVRCATATATATATTMRACAKHISTCRKRVISFSSITNYDCDCGCGWTPVPGFRS